MKLRTGILQLFLVLLSLSASAQGDEFYQHLKIITTDINFYRFGTSQLGWNNAGQDARVTGQKIADLVDRRGVATGAELWVDTASNMEWLSCPHVYAFWEYNVSQRQWSAQDSAWTISIRALDPLQDYTFLIYASHQTYHNPTISYNVNGTIHLYENVNVAGHGLLEVTATSDVNGTIFIRIFSSGTYASIAAMKFYKTP